MSALIHFIGTDPRTVVHISECEGCTIIEPMRFLRPRETRDIARKQRLSVPPRGVGATANQHLSPSPITFAHNDDPSGPDQAA